MREQEADFYVDTLKDEFKINRTIATFIGLLNAPKTAQELVNEFQVLIPDASTAVIEPIVAKFLKDLHRLEVVRKEGEADIAPRTPNYQPGEAVGQYLITELLSLHNDVQVYRATDGETGQPVVLKMFAHTPKSMGKNTRLRQDFEEFQQEIAIMRALPAHPYICKLLGYQARPHHFAVLEYLPGEALSDAARINTISEADKTALATQILLSLAHLHAHGIVHGDIHSRNFVVSGNQVKMIDFGFSHRVGVSRRKQFITGGGVPTYIAPERVKQHNYNFSKKPADFRSEVYQIALVIFKLYHKELPFAGNTWLERATSIMTYDFGQHLNAAIPHEQVLLRALHKDPAARYACGRKLLAAWQQALAVESPAAALAYAT